ncbi:MAG TPA: hypothetical protein VGK25_10210, partial [Ignavibacteria bacterium]
MKEYVSFEVKTLATLVLFLCLPIPFLLYAESYKILALFIAIPLLLYVFFTLEYNFRFYLIFLIFFGTYIHVMARIQPINLISYILIIFFILNHDSIEFNKHKLPGPFKIVFFSLIGAVFY